MSTLLILTPQLPYPPQQGTSLRNFHLLRGLAGRHEITLLSYLEDDQQAEQDSIAPLHALCKAIHTIPVPKRTRTQRLTQLLTSPEPDMAHRLSNPDFAERLKQILSGRKAPFDVVQVEGLEMAPVIPVIRRISPKSKIVFDNHNAETALQRSALQTDLASPRRWPAALYSLSQIRRLSKFERWACRSVDRVIAVSEEDRSILHAALPEVSIWVVPNSIDVRQYSQESGEGGQAYDVLFSGKMDYRPNIDAVEWFAARIWPEIVRNRPEATWGIVGQKPHDRLARIGALPGVSLIGRVERVAPYLAAATVYVLPLRMGSGTRLKLVEAMAAGKAIVSTTVGAAGYPVTHGREMLIANEPTDFSRSVLSLLSDQSRRIEMGKIASAFARQYDWRKIVPKLDKIYDDMLARSTAD